MDRGSGLGWELIRFEWRVKGCWARMHGVVLTALRLVFKVKTSLSQFSGIHESEKTRS